jgi:hypothetical protein
MVTAEVIQMGSDVKDFFAVVFDPNFCGTADSNFARTLCKSVARYM